MDELESALAQQAPPKVQDDPSLFELPPLIIDGIPTPVEKMTQAQLRAFIPLMLKYSTGEIQTGRFAKKKFWTFVSIGRGKPGWGRDSTRPEWWPKELPWANVRMDARTEEEKQKISWTHALRKIVINCYKYHGREDLLPAFSEEDEKANAIATANANVSDKKYFFDSRASTSTCIHQIKMPTLFLSFAQSFWNSLTLAQVGTLKVQNHNSVSASSNANHSGTTTITTVSSNNVTNNNIITTSTPKMELPQTTTIQISNQSIANSNHQQVCLESMQLNDVDVRTNRQALFLIHVLSLSLPFFWFLVMLSFLSLSFFSFLVTFRFLIMIFLYFNDFKIFCRFSTKRFFKQMAMERSPWSRLIPALWQITRRLLRCPTEQRHKCKESRRWVR